MYSPSRSPLLFNIKFMLNAKRVYYLWKKKEFVCFFTFNSYCKSKRACLVSKLVRLNRLGELKLELEVGQDSVLTWESAVLSCTTPGAFLVAQLVKNLPAMLGTWVRSLGWEDPWRRERLPTSVLQPGEFCDPWQSLSQRVGCDFHFWHFGNAQYFLVVIFIATGNHGASEVVQW